MPYDLYVALHYTTAVSQNETSYPLFYLFIFYDAYDTNVVLS